MASKQFQPVPTNKVTFFKHFPHYFVRPYDAQLHYGLYDFVEKLNPKNCEWMMRPNIAMSEAAQALRANWEIIKDGDLINDTARTTIQNLMTPVLQNLANLDSKDKSCQPTGGDVYNVMRWCFESPELDASLGNWMQESAAMFVFVSQLRAMRALVSNPERYAVKLLNDCPAAVQFKTTKTIASMQNMLTTLCAPAASASISLNRDVRALANQLVNPTEGQGTSSGLQRPTNLPSEGLQPPGEHASSPASRPTSTPTEQQSSQPGFANELMDMVIALQGQLQALQRASQSTTIESQTVPSQQAKTGSKRKATRVRRPSAPSDMPSTSQGYPECDDFEVDELQLPDPGPIKKKRTKSTLPVDADEPPPADESSTLIALSELEYPVVEVEPVKQKRKKNKKKDH